MADLKWSSGGLYLAILKHSIEISSKPYGIIDCMDLIECKKTINTCHDKRLRVLDKTD